MKTILVYGLKNVVGGIEKYLMMMQKHLQNDINFVFLVESCDDLLYEKFILGNNGNVVYLPERHNIKKYIKTFASILDIYKSETHILYVNVGHISFDIIPIKMAIKKGYRVITHSHNAMQEPIYNFKYRVRQYIMRSIGMYMLRSLPVERLAVSDEAGQYLYRREPYTIVTPGIDINEFVYNESIHRKVITQLGISNNLVLGFVGRLVAVKNPVFLIDVLIEVKKTISNVKLLVIGDGVMKEQMLEKAKNNDVANDVIFTGYIDNVHECLQAVNILLAPSYSEGLGLGIIESQSLGIPCICAKGNVPSSVNVTGSVCFSSLSSGARCWADNVVRILSQPIERKEMNSAVRQSGFNFDVVAKKLYEIFDKDEAAITNSK